MTRDDASCWEAVCARDPSADGRFCFAVKTTGVFCRPSCRARRPLRKNVSFFETPARAQAAGFRACKRCLPLDATTTSQRAELITRLCRFIETSESAPSLEALGEVASLSPFHVQRVFKAATGVTPRQYAAATRAKRVRRALATEPSVTDALYAAGYGSSGRFYEKATSLLGATPLRFRAGLTDEPIRYALAACTLGHVLVAATARGVCAVTMGDDSASLIEGLTRSFPKAQLVGGEPSFQALVGRVVAAIETPSMAAKLPLDVRGTAFQHRVWKALAAIPPGETRSYLEVAKALGAPTSSRAVAQACGANPTAVLVPCHRVVRGDGGLSGYRWGVKRKAALLERERRAKRR